MPYSIRKTKNGYGVLNTQTKKWKSKDTSKLKAEAQKRLLDGVDHGWKPTGEPAKKKKSKKKR